MGGNHRESLDTALFPWGGPSGHRGVLGDKAVADGIRPWGTMKPAWKAGPLLGSHQRFGCRQGTGQRDIQEPGGGETAGLRCSDRALCTVLAGLGSLGAQEEEMVPMSRLTPSAPFQVITFHSSWSATLRVFRGIYSSLWKQF